MSFKSVQEIRLYSLKQILVSAFFGGPAAIGILFFQNLKRLKKEALGWLILIISTLFPGFIVFVLFMNRGGLIANLPTVTWPLLYLALAYVIYILYIQKPIKAANTDTKITKPSNWTVLGLTITGFAFHYSLHLILLWLVPEFKGQYKAYEENKIYYDQFVLDSELDLMAEYMIEFEYFEYNEEYQVKLSKKEGQFELFIPYLSAYWNDPEYMSIVKDEAEILQSAFGLPVVIVLKDYSFWGNVITKRINDPTSL